MFQFKSFGDTRKKNINGGNLCTRKGTTLCGTKVHKIN